MALSESQRERAKNLFKKLGLKGFNEPKKTPSHDTKSHVVVAKVGDEFKVIRFGQQGIEGAGKNPKSEEQKKRREAFKARHKENIKKGKFSAAYWSNKVKWILIIGLWLNL